MIRRPPRSTLFPTPPLSRSPAVVSVECAADEIPPFAPFLTSTVKDAAVEEITNQEGDRPNVAASDIWSVPLLVCNLLDRKSTRLNSSHQIISYAVFCLKKKR